MEIVNSDSLKGYLNRLMYTLEYACQLGASIHVERFEIHIRVRNPVSDFSARLTFDNTVENLDRLTVLEGKLADVERRLREEKRQAEVRRNALAKLTKEERTLLGL